MATAQNTKRATDKILATYVTSEVEQAFKAHCRRQHRTVAGELRLLIEQALEAEQTEAAA